MRFHRAALVFFVMSHWMDAFFRILLHPCRIVCQFAERSLQLTVFTYFIRILGRSCAILILNRLSTVILRAEHAYSFNFLHMTVAYLIMLLATRE